MNKEIRIVVLQRGWVAVGLYSEVGENIVLENSSVIRYWGTKNGLGELKDKPLEKTMLDKAGTIRANKFSVVLTIDADFDGWIKSCS